MQVIGDSIRFSASDLVGHLDCHHLTALDAAIARGTATKPKIWDPVLETLAERRRGKRPLIRVFPAATWLGRVPPGNEPGG
jgi:hypothetical protein